MKTIDVDVKSDRVRADFGINEKSLFKFCVSGDRAEPPLQVPSLLAQARQDRRGELHLEPRHRGVES